ncbi:MAG TPA: DUF5995 family protein [Vicinamibacterales bacterium]|nr:DUF5995 family protein [Vicinamibacterales bacterium]
MSLIQLLARTPVQSVDEVIAIMKAIDHDLPDTDGVKWFNRLYLRVTTSVGSAVGTRAFNDTAFMTKLDVVFANLYFSALAAGSVDVRRAPSAWRPLLEARNQSGIARIQFALAGMTAHINRDLPDGIVQSFLALGGDPIAADLREQDFDSINEILERVEEEVKVEFAVGLVGAIDRLGGPVDDAVAMWKVRAARSAAWTNAQVLWGLRPVPRLRDRFFDRLDGLVALTGRGLLLPRVS